MTAKISRTPEHIAESENADRIKRALHEEGVSLASTTTPGIGHDRGPPLTVSIPEAAQALGIGRNSAYEAAARGEIPTVRIGARLLVPTRALDALLDGAVEAWRQRQQQTA